MSFEAEGMKVVQLIDPTKGQRYVDMVDDRGDVSSINQLYNLAAGRRDDVNPTADGSVSWLRICSYDTDSKEAWQDWQERTLFY